MPSEDLLDHGGARMTPETLRARRHALGLSQQALHDAIRAAMDEAPTPHGRSIISRWESGRVPIPSWMRVVLSYIADTRSEPC